MRSSKLAIASAAEHLSFHDDLVLQKELRGRGIEVEIMNWQTGDFRHSDSVYVTCLARR